MGRRRGSSTFPVARIKKIMQADEDVGKIATATPVLVAKALECLMEDVLRDAAAIALNRRTKTVTPQHLKQSVSAEAHFDFLRPTFATVPSLDDANAPPPTRRGKRPRASARLSAPAPAAVRLVAPKREVTLAQPTVPVATLQVPPAPSIAVKDLAASVMSVQNTKRARLLGPPASSPVAVSAGAQLSCPSLPSPVPMEVSRLAKEDDDDDYDDDDTKPQSNPPEVGIAALRIDSNDAPPVVIPDFGLPPQAIKAASTQQQRPHVTASERVSVHALLS